MAGIDETLAGLGAAPGWEARRGTIEDDGDGLVLVVGGTTVTPRWAPGYYPSAGDVVIALRAGELWTVLGSPLREPDAPAPARGQVTSVPTGSSRIGVSVPGHGTLLCPFLDSYTPAIGHTVMLLWPAGDGVPTVVGRPGEVPEPTPKPPPEDRPSRPTNPTPPPVRSGRQRFTAVDSRTRIAAGWSTNHGRHVMQGSWGSLAFQGGWFYGNGPRSFFRGDREITSARIRLGARRRVGYYNQSITLVLRRHTHRTRPSGALSLTGSTVSVTVPSGGGARWVDLPTSWHAGLASGHGVALVGTGSSAYGGVVGTGSGSGLDPESGLLDIRWEIPALEEE